MTAAVCGVAGIGGTPRSVAAQLTAPALVESSLLRFAHDDADMVRRVDAKAYERLAKEEGLTRSRRRGTGARRYAVTARTQ
jgi:hypothetical protein